MNISITPATIFRYNVGFYNATPIQIECLHLIMYLLFLMEGKELLYAYTKTNIEIYMMPYWKVLGWRPFIYGCMLNFDHTQYNVYFEKNIELYFYDEINDRDIPCTDWVLFYRNLSNTYYTTNWSRYTHHDMNHFQFSVYVDYFYSNRFPKHTNISQKVNCLITEVLFDTSSNYKVYWTWIKIPIHEHSILRLNYIEWKLYSVYFDEYQNSIVMNIDEYDHDHWKENYIFKENGNYYATRFNMEGLETILNEYDALRQLDNFIHRKEPCFPPWFYDASMYFLFVLFVVNFSSIFLSAILIPLPKSMLEVQF
jgi:hypothetical protein